jgi:hypothetical protein
MLSRIRTRITFANVIALIALFVALGGSVYAAGKLSGKTIKKGSEPGNRIKKDTVTGKQVKESTLGKVPKAADADSAGSAGTANAAFSTYHFDAIDMPDTYGTIGTLSIPTAGSFVIVAKFTALDGSATNVTNGRCTLTAGGDVDESDFDALGNSTDDTEQVALQVAHTFAAPGAAVLACQDGTASATGQALYTRITAIQVKSLTNGTF